MDSLQCELFKMSSDESTLSFDDSNASENNTSKKKPRRNFRFEIDISGKNIFVVQHVFSGKKTRYVVTNKHDWSHKLNDEIWKVFRKDCSWSFKRADARSNGDVFVEGKCSFKDCNAAIHVHAEGNKTLVVQVRNFDRRIVHVNNKRRTTGSLKENIEEKLKHASAAKVRADLAGKLMNPGDAEPSHLPKLAAIRKQKSRMAMKRAESSDAMESLCKMKQQKYRKSIQDIWMNPLVVMYSTPFQRKYYQSSLIKRRVLSIDGTGINVIAPHTSSISEKRSASSHKKKYQSIFLYTVNLVGHFSVPIAQMVSQRHTMSLLTYWMKNWCPSNKTPHEVILDQSAALFGACVQSFTPLNSTNEYITACMNCLLNGTQRPAVFLRLDRFHFVRTPHNLKQFQNVDPLKVKFFKAVFGVLILCHDIAAARKIIIDLFTVMRNRFVNELSTHSLVQLQDICNTHEINIDLNEQSVDANLDDGQSFDATYESDHFRKTSSYR